MAQPPRRGRHRAGQRAVETLALFVRECRARGLVAMIDTLAGRSAHRWRAARAAQRRHPAPRRDEETTRGKVIEYRHVKRVKSKYDVLISAAGGVDLKEARGAIFNGASIVVVNIVPPDSPWQGIRTNEDVGKIARQFLATIE
jgi:3-keto-L-gulonate-6-phosphate decarboxylase